MPKEFYECLEKEFKQNDFAFLNSECKVKLIYGKQDEYLDKARIEIEIRRAAELFEKRLEVLPFDGKHVVNVDYINDLI